MIILLSFEGGFGFWKQLRPFEATCVGSGSREAWQSSAWFGIGCRDKGRLSLGPRTNRKVVSLQWCQASFFFFFF